MLSDAQVREIKQNRDCEAAHCHTMRVEGMVEFGTETLIEHIDALPADREERESQRAELLAACKAIRAWLGGAPREDIEIEPGGEAAVDEMLAIRDQLDAAIARAEAQK